MSVNKALREVSPPGTLPMWNKYIPAAAKIPDRASLVGTVNPANPVSTTTRIFTLTRLTSLNRTELSIFLLVLREYLAPLQKIVTKNRWNLLRSSY